MNSISDVLRRLEVIIAETKATQSPMGYFAALYYKMTLSVSRAIDQGLFENGARMDRLDVNFARRYFDAYDTWQAGQSPSQAWAVAFEATRDDRITVLQHLILGVNAHINLDLGIAAAQTRPKDAIFGLKPDFDMINQNIGGLVNEVQDRLAEIWLPFKWMDWFLRTEDEGMINFSIKMARMSAWKTATTIAFAPTMELERKLVYELDAAVAFFGKKIVRPGFYLRTGLWWMRLWEKGTVSEKIDILLQ
ncbi:MAG: hypothetical protein KGS48_01060 [Bacteroidetes bacterium]|nr:hypothetical protein [Bacteroidota bacterium]